MNKKQQEIYNWLIEHPGYLKKGLRVLCLKYFPKYDSKDVMIASKQARIDSKKNSHEEVSWIGKLSEEFKKPFYKDFKDSYSDQSKYQYGKSKVYKKSYNQDNVLFIGDLHAPWILDGYLEFCREQQDKYDCGTVIFAGDIIDSGSWSYHEHDPDGLGVKDELYAAKKQLKNVFKIFPKAISLLGNHDLLISRKAKTAGLSQEFIRDLSNVIEAPSDWLFCHEMIRDNVRYIHGSTGDAFKRAVDSRMSTCQGHLHSKTFVQWSVSEKDAIFGLQVGAGFDRNKYAFDYAKPFPKKPVISCGLILDSGTTPLVKLMPL